MKHVLVSLLKAKIKRKIKDKASKQAATILVEVSTSVMIRNDD